MYHVSIELQKHEWKFGRMKNAAFSSSPKLSRVFLYLDRNTGNMFSISFTKHHDKKRKQLVNFDYQSVHVNSLCSHHHYVNSSC